MGPVASRTPQALELAELYPWKRYGPKIVFQGTVESGFVLSGIHELAIGCR